MPDGIVGSLAPTIVMGPLLFFAGMSFIVTGRVAGGWRGQITHYDGRAAVFFGWYCVLAGGLLTGYTALALILRHAPFVTAVLYCALYGLIPALLITFLLQVTGRN